MAGLAALAVSQPLLDLAARQPQFLVAHGLSPVEVVAVAVAVVAIPAMALALASLGGRLTGWWAGVVVSVPVALISLYVGGRIGLSGVLLLAAAAGISIGSAILYVRRPSLQKAARHLAWMPLVVLAYFFLVIPPAVLAGEGESPAIEEVTRPVPVVVVVLDELPLASLIDPDGSLLSGRYPGFGRLAADGVWYRNAITVETRTTEAIPAILTGRQVEDGLVPNHANHPSNLMTMLARTHDVHAVEPVTSLCPASLCRGDGSSLDWSTLATDLAVVYGHMVVPEPWSGGLPTIDQNWTGFASDQTWNLVEAVGEAVDAGRRAQAEAFLASLRSNGSRPILRVAHLVLPHRPWDFLPDGSRHGQETFEGYGERGWGPDPYLVADGWRRHLFQVAYTDRLLGEMLESLDRLGLYDSSLVVVVADHGVHFAPNVEDMRVTNRDTVGSILPVPLFVKYPQQVEAPAPGTIDDRRAETTDVVPTVLDVVGAPEPEGVEGRSLLDSFRRSQSVLDLRGKEFPVGVEGDEKLQMAAERERWFVDADPWSLVPDPALRSVLGSPLPETVVPRTSVPLVDEKRSPPLLEGRLRLEESTGREVAALVDGGGQVRALSRLLDVDDGAGRFFFYVRPDADATGPWKAYLLADVGSEP